MSENIEGLKELIKHNDRIIQKANHADALADALKVLADHVYSCGDYCDCNADIDAILRQARKVLKKYRGE